MSEQDRWIREEQRERRRIVTEARMLWMHTRHAAGQRDRLDKDAVKTVARIVDRALDARASWADIERAIRSFAPLPIGKEHRRSLWDLDHAIGEAAQERRRRERQEIETVERAVSRAAQEQRAAADLATLRAKHPGMTMRAILEAEGIAPSFGR